MSEDRRWMYEGWNNGKPNINWVRKTDDFVNRAFSIPNAERDGVLCPCLKCANYKKQNKREMSIHLFKNGFMPRYLVWIEHGERVNESPALDETFPEIDHWDEMLTDVVNFHQPSAEDEAATAAANNFYELLEASKEPVHKETTMSILSAVTRLMSFKTQHNMSISAYDTFLMFVHDLLPKDSKLPTTFSESKKLLSSLGMPYEKIDACVNGCMLFRKENKDKSVCDYCNEPRYVQTNSQESSEDSETRSRPIARKVLRYLPIIPRIQRLYLAEESAKQMRYHKEGHRENPELLVHPSDGEAWKSFDRAYPRFAEEPRNVRLGLCTDGFTPFSFGTAPYSCWPVFVTPYNLPPGMCMKKENIFLSLVIPGPEHPGKNLDVYMQPLYDDLQKLWDEGVVTYDSYTKKTFRLKACYFWSVSDFPALGMVSGHSTHGKFACPVCLGGLSAFWLTNGTKYCWFDCHRQFLPAEHAFRRSLKGFRKNKQIFNPPPPRLTGEQVHAQIKSLVPNKGKGNHTFEGYGTTHNWTHISGLWKLPYFEKLMLRHNIDVMHNEKNVGETIWATCFDIPERTKDNVKARLDAAEICDRSKFNMQKKPSGRWEKPRALFSLDRAQKILVFQWLKSLKFPDMYAANIRRGVNLKQLKVTGMKSHDYHIFMERLLPVALRGFIHDDVWVCLAELSFFYRQLCSREIDPVKMKEVEENIPILLCKLEKIFPPGFFTSMMHLIIHLPYEARIGGPVHYRWMYPYERAMGKSKKWVKNKARVEGCITEAYIVDEISNFVSLYFASDVPSSRNKKQRVDDGYDTFSTGCSLSTFQVPGRKYGNMGSRDLSRDEHKAVMLYIYTNTLEMEDFVKQFEQTEWRGRGQPTSRQLDKLRKNGAARGHPNLIDWFRSYCMNTSSINKDLAQISHGCRTRVLSLSGYDVNGYRFRSAKYERRKPSLTTVNSGIFTSSTEGDVTTEYFGIIEDIIEVTFDGTRPFKLVLFDCRWFHPVSGVRRTPRLGLVEIKHNTSLPGFEPFILPHQCSQVYYTQYPCKSGSLKDWWVVHHVPKHDDIQIPGAENPSQHPNTEVYQERSHTNTFGVDPGNGLDDTFIPSGADIVQDDTDLEILNKQPTSNDPPEPSEPPLDGPSYDEVESDDNDEGIIYDDPEDF